VLSPGREPHWLGLSIPFDQAARRRRDAIILLRIFENVRISTIILKEAGDSKEGFPGLWSTIPFNPFSEARWYPRLTSGERTWRRTEGLILLTCFQVEYGIPSGSGADVGDHLDRVMAI